MNKNIDYLAVDIGASSGRVMLGCLKENLLTIEELGRFPNFPINTGDEHYWNILMMYQSMCDAFKKYSPNHNSVSIGIDTFGMDFGLLDKNGMLLSNPYSYRGVRGKRGKEKFDQTKKGKLFDLTGVADREYNTSYLLHSMTHDREHLLGITNSLLFIPDLLAYFLTGEIFCDESIASPGQIIEPGAKVWNKQIFDLLNLNMDILSEIREAASPRGKLLPDVAKSCNLPQNTEVAFAVHDTAVALEAVPSQSKIFAFVSSGTWSLMGVTSNKPVINNFVRENSFSNICDLNSGFMILKNIMGMWVLQSCKKEWESERGIEISWEHLLESAEHAKTNTYIDINDYLFFPEGNMTNRIRQYCLDTCQKAPESEGEVVRVVIESLAMSYKQTFLELQEIAENEITKLFIVGGGSLNTLLNQYTANLIGVKVVAGPKEATVIGNVLKQAVENKIIDQKEKVKIIDNSFDIKIYIPQDTAEWKEKWLCYRKLTHENKQKAGGEK